MASKRDPILDLAKFIDESVRIKFAGGREVTGVLKGYDQLVNLVLDEAVEYFETPGETRQLGLLVCRGTSVMLISPVDGTQELYSNPFLPQE
ncbi:U6 snRNA-associated Sm-like protein [Achlya hypogyna]|uniref:U6 snRNA-associated Sm-like protein n=1 Tax=Achlya hypogyna TaxID=1202772 RepID=A0A1V9ZVD2_ACHHY|nr:U6 snRNA-associated Sm-like protein [Achlya hypogyna]